MDLETDNLLSHSSLRTYRARWIFPVAGPPIEDGFVSIWGDRIESVGKWTDEKVDIDFGNSAIIPGLVNAHTHLDLTGARGLIPPGSPEHFTDWLKGVIAFRRTQSREQIDSAIRAGLLQSLHYGTTLIGDIASEGSSWNLLADAPIRSLVFRELIGLSDARSTSAREAAEQWLESHPDSVNTRAGTSPHAPYSANKSLLTDPVDTGPITIHLAESPGEIELLEKHGGPFVEFLQFVGAWDPAGLIDSVSSVISRRTGNNRSVYAHCNYLPISAADHITPMSSIVICPRTHAAFGHPPHPYREFQKRGVRICLGTDSLASNPDLDILAEARFLRRTQPDIPGDILLRMATLDGAISLGWGPETGSLEVGKSGDLVVISLPDRNADPFSLLFDGYHGERHTRSRGKWLL